ncbi:flavin reductase (DIM6/NTAB) family NADH-FMN oxidoreductase RutF [Marinobacterium sp. MBR-111]|jgi:flavin reductase (DIM6/NTAB) family NADH-FMN oxidoreductase RutF|uniref:flavin reductase family protein n=1 Tax=Marinobacterium sp. MBR-111 TaxID=3156463 RepID=UPI00339B00DB
MIIEANQVSSTEIYHTLTQVIIPRPIAWVLSPNDEAGSSHNLAPFSFFNVVCSDPPILMLSIGSKSDGSMKDTCHNLLEYKRCVIHIAANHRAQMVSDSAAELARGESELTLTGQTLMPFDGTGLMRLPDAPVALACRLHQHIEVGNRPQNLLLVEVERIWIDDAVCGRDAKGRMRFEADRIKPLARLGGSEYATLGELFSIRRS